MQTSHVLPRLFLCLLLCTQLVLFGCAPHRHVHAEDQNSAYVTCPRCGQSFAIEGHRRSKALPAAEGAVGFGAVGAVVGGGVGAIVGAIVTAPTVVGIPAGILAGMTIGAAGGGLIGGTSGGVAAAKHQDNAVQCPHCGEIFDVAPPRDTTI